MNKRILEFAEQATIQSVSENFTGEKLEIITPSKEWTLKFAELIVRECALIAADADSVYYGIVLRHFDFEVEE